MALLSMKGSGSHGSGVELGECVEMSTQLPSVFTSPSGEVYLRAGFISQGESATYPDAYASYGFDYFSVTPKSVEINVNSNGDSNIWVGNNVFIRRNSDTTGSILISRDFGATWTVKGIGNSSYINDIIYANGVWIAISATTNCYRSTDDANTWTPVALGNASGNLFIDYDPVNNQFVIAGSAGGAMYTKTSNNLGATWFANSHSVTSSNPYAMRFVKNGQWVMTTSTGVWMTNSVGTSKTWTNVSSATLYPGSSKIGFDGTNVYAVGAANNSIVMSSDFGSTWATITTETYTPVIQGLSSVGTLTFGRNGYYTTDGSHWYIGLLPYLQEGTSFLSNVITDYATGKSYIASTRWKNPNYLVSISEVVAPIKSIGIPYDSDTHINTIPYMRIK